MLFHLYIGVLRMISSGIGHIVQVIHDILILKRMRRINV